MKKILLPGIISAVAVFAVSMLVGYLSNFIFPGLKGEYENACMFRPWNDPLMMAYFAYPLILAFILSLIWDKVKTIFTGSYINNVLNFTFLYWLATSLPGMFMSLSSFKISIIMVVSWTISGLLQILAASLITIKMNK